MRSEVVYFIKHPASIAPLENEVSTAINCSVSLPNNHAWGRSNGRATPNLIKRRLEKSAIWVFLKIQ